MKVNVFLIEVKRLRPVNVVFMSLSDTLCVSISPVNSIQFYNNLNFVKTVICFSEKRDYDLFVHNAIIQNNTTFWRHSHQNFWGLETLVHRYIVHHIIIPQLAQNKCIKNCSLSVYVSFRPYSSFIMLLSNSFQISFFLKVGTAKCECSYSQTINLASNMPHNDTVGNYYCFFKILLNFTSPSIYFIIWALIIIGIFLIVVVFLCICSCWVCRLVHLAL